MKRFLFFFFQNSPDFSYIFRHCGGGEGDCELVGKQMHHILWWIYWIWVPARLKWVEWLNFHYCLKFWRNVALANVCTRVTKGESQIAVKLMDGCLAQEFNNKKELSHGSHDCTLLCATFFSLGFCHHLICSLIASRQIDVSCQACVKLWLTSASSAL